MRAAGDSKVKYMEIKMEEVIISSVHPGASKNAEGFPTEAVSFNYGTIKWVYTQQKRKDGSGGGNVTGGWDLVKGKAKA
jgi:type VI secretion system secreted protein Hcp